MSEVRVVWNKEPLLASFATRFKTGKRANKKSPGQPGASFH